MLYFRTRQRAADQGRDEGPEVRGRLLRREVGHKVQLRYAPELVFELDQSITHGAHISEVLHELKNEGKLGEEDAE